MLCPARTTIQWRSSIGSTAMQPPLHERMWFLVRFQELWYIFNQMTNLHISIQWKNTDNTEGREERVHICLGQRFFIGGRLHWPGAAVLHRATRPNPRLNQSFPGRLTPLCHHHSSCQLRLASKPKVCHIVGSKTATQAEIRSLTQNPGFAFLYRKQI